MNKYKMRVKDFITVRKAIRAARVPTNWTKEVGYRENFDLNLSTHNLMLAPLSGEGINTDLIEPYSLDSIKGAEIELRDDSEFIKFDIYLYSYYCGESELEYNVYVYFNTKTGEAHVGDYDEMK